jgi:hypothetical protein
MPTRTAVLYTLAGLAMPLYALAAAGCGGAGPTGGGSPPPGSADQPRRGALGPVPLLPSPDPTRPFNHSREVTLAAREGHVVVAAIDEHFAGEDTFETTGFHKRVAVAVSHDGGDSFAVLDPGIGDQTTDPVVRVGSDGTFWLATWDTAVYNDVLAASLDRGDSWRAVATNLGFGDKEWMAVDDGGGAVYLGATGGLWKLDLHGQLLARDPAGGQMAGGYVDAAGAHFISLAYTLLRWDGSAPAVDDGLPLSPGNGADDYTATSQSLGATRDGGQWSIRTVAAGAARSIVLRVRHLPDDEGMDLPVSDPAALAFFPAAALDDQGRLHVLWYESSGSVGVLKYARSLGPNLGEGFGPALVVDDAACPGDGWLPFFDSAAGGRRLREYVDLAVDGPRAHLAWTHAPSPPSRVYTTWIELP